MTTRPPRVVFSDDDHILTLIRTLLETEDREAALADFLAPDPSDGIDFEELTSGLRHSAELDVLQASSPDAVADMDPTVVILRRGGVDAATIEASPRLRLIQRLGHRVRYLDLDAARRHGVAVSCLPRDSLVSVAEHVVMLTLALARRLLESDSAVRTGRTRPGQAPGRNGSVYNWAGITGMTSLRGRTMGIVGLGEVGGLVADRAHALGMRVIHHNRTRGGSDVGSTWHPLEDLLALSDVVTVHVPGSPRTPVIDARALEAMRPGAFLINTSRGHLVDEDALYDALVGGQIAGAALDVHADEPRLPDRITALENVVLTPHVAAGSRHAVVDEAAAIFANVRAILDDGQPRHGLVAGAGGTAGQGGSGHD